MSLTTFIQTLQAVTLETLLNQLLIASPDLQPELDTLHDKTVQIQIKNPNACFYLKFTPGGIIILREYSDPVDVCIQSSASALYNLALQKEKLASLRSGDIRIEGDVQTARQLEKIFNLSSLDWEELLAKYLGDLPAYLLLRGGRQLQKHGQQLLDTLTNSTRDYLQEEARYLPTCIEIENHLRDVSELRLRSDRLHARVERLLQHT